MKPLIAILALCLLADPLAAVDNRTVSGITVDLDPVHAWFAKKKGERPLPHWKRLHILNITATNGVDRCLVKIEGASAEVLVEHLPERITRHFKTKHALEAQLAVFNGSKAEKKKLQAEHTAMTKTENNDAERFTDFALDTGKKYAGYPVWDCGTR